MKNALKYILVIVLLFNLSINGSSRSKEENNDIFVFTSIAELVFDIEASKITNVLPYLNNDELKETREIVLKITENTFEHHYDIHCFYKIQEATLKAFLKSICMCESVTEDQKKLFSKYLLDQHYGRLVLIILTAQLDYLCELYEKLYNKLKDKCKININPEDLNGIKNRYLASFVHRPNH